MDVFCDYCGAKLDVEHENCCTQCGAPFDNNAGVKAYREEKKRKEKDCSEKDIPRLCSS